MGRGGGGGISGGSGAREEAHRTRRDTTTFESGGSGLGSPGCKNQRISSSQVPFRNSVPSNRQPLERRPTTTRVLCSPREGARVPLRAASSLHARRDEQRARSWSLGALAGSWLACPQCLDRNVAQLYWECPHPALPVPRTPCRSQRSAAHPCRVTSLALSRSLLHPLVASRAL